jgi:hypothetical protein
MITGTIWPVMVDLANAALQAAAAQNVNTTALIFIEPQLTRPDIGELTRRAQAIRRSSLDLKLLDRCWARWRLAATRHFAAYRRQRGAPTAGKQGPQHGKDVLRLEQRNGGLAMAGEQQIVAKPRPWLHAAAVNYPRNSHWRNSTKASFLSNIGKE